jgi:hypothetical protein
MVSWENKLLFPQFRKYRNKIQMELSKAADTLKELGHPTRLSVYRELVKAGHKGYRLANCRSGSTSQPLR